MTKRPTAARGNAMKAAMLVPEHDEEPAAEQVPAQPRQKPAADRDWVDGRSLHRTGRKHQFATRIKEETHEKMIAIVQREKEEGQPRFTLAELIEKAVDLYERDRWGR